MDSQGDPENGCWRDDVIVLHVGAGTGKLPEWIKATREVKLDLDPRNQPDIVADMRNLGNIGPYDGVYCCHALEHVSRDDGLKTLREFRRVLKPGGKAIVVVPDLEGITPTDHVLYESEAGPVTGADMYWGMQSLIERWPHMAHKFGYVARTLKAAFHQAGFRDVTVERRPGWNLLGLAT
jgi:predicted SAM-dependent methyltransferase